MATSFFGNNSATPTTTTKLGRSIITLPGGDNLVCHQAGFEFARNVSILHPLNLTKRVLSSSEPVGKLTLGIVVGPSKGIAAFLRQYADECSVEANRNIITLAPTDDCNSGSKVRWSMYGLLLTGIQGNIARTEQGNLVIPTVQMLFTDFKMDD